MDGNSPASSAATSAIRSPPLGGIGSRRSGDASNPSSVHSAISGGNSTTSTIHHDPVIASLVQGGRDRDRVDSSDEHVPQFPLLKNTADAAPGPGRKKSLCSVQDDEPAVATPFARMSSPEPQSMHWHSFGTSFASSARANPQPHSSGRHQPELLAGRGASDGLSDPEQTSERLTNHMHKFNLYETASRYYIVGGDITESHFRILNIDRGIGGDPGLAMVDDKTTYTVREMNQLLDTIDDGNRSTGGIKLRCTAWGLLGFIKFTGPYYMLLITKKRVVAMLGGHYIYQVEGTELVPLTPPRYKPDSRNSAESRFIHILKQLELNRNFYYSYTYDITRTLQFNMLRERQALADGHPATSFDHNTMFVWNAHLLKPALDILHDPYAWCRPIIHGFIDQGAICIYGKIVHVTLVARRSRFFAGARFLKRGANDLGYVANDVESEQIVAEAETTSFHAPGNRLYSSPQYTSYVQHRGSIPLYWSQDVVGVAPKPPINLHRVDPFFSAAALHFDDLFSRYGAPVYVVNLVKEAEKVPREGKLMDEFVHAIDYLNQSLPAGRKIIHTRWDMGRATKTNQNVVAVLERIGDSVVRTTGFFHNGDGRLSVARTQNGVGRTNCIDCLDRTNAAQFVFGTRALGYQLHALGILSEPWVDLDTDAVNMLASMYHAHGDTIALQYGGSQLVNTMETYRRLNHWSSNSRDMIQSFRRFCHNSFLDGQRQEAYNLFLGNYQFSADKPYLWDLSTDYYLHHSHPRNWSIASQHRRDYIKWFTPDRLERRRLPPYRAPRHDLASRPLAFFDQFWLEYYRPFTLSTLQNIFSYKMERTIDLVPLRNSQEGKYDLSPFKNRGLPTTASDGAVAAAAAAAADDSGDRGCNQEEQQQQQQQQQHQQHQQHHQQQLDHHHHRRHCSRVHRADVMSIHDAHGRELLLLPGESIHGFTIDDHNRPDSHYRKQQQQQQQSPLLDDYAAAAAAAAYDPIVTGMDADGQLLKCKPAALEKTRAAQWTFSQLVHASLNPSVSAAEAEDYAVYIRHPQCLPLVVGSSSSPSSSSSFANNTAANNISTRVEGGDSSGVEYDFPTCGTTAAIAAAAAVDAEYAAYLVGSIPPDGLTPVATPDEVALYTELVRVAENPLSVTEDDVSKKRYKAYRKWVKGKSLFKQYPICSID